MGSRLTFEDLDRVAFAEFYNGLLPVRTTVDVVAHELRLAALVGPPDPGDLHAEELLDRGADLRLRRVGVDFERVFAALLITRRGLLGDDRADDGAMNRRHRLLPLLFRGLFRRRLFRGGLPGPGFRFDLRRLPGG